MLVKTEIDETLGTDGSTGPAKCISIGGTESGGNIQEILVDATGHIQVDVLTTASHEVTNAGTFPVQVNGDALTSLQLIDDVVGTDGSTGPAKCISIGGTESGGNIQEILVDNQGHIQADIVYKFSLMVSIQVVVSGNTIDHYTVIIDTHGYSKLLVNITATTIDGSQFTSANWSNDSGFSSTQLIYNGILQSYSGDYIKRTFTAVVNPDAETTINIVTFVFNQIPLRYLRFNLHHTWEGGGSISFVAYYTLSN